MLLIQSSLLISSMLHLFLFVHLYEGRRGTTFAHLGLRPLAWRARRCAVANLPCTHAMNDQGHPCFLNPSPPSLTHPIPFSPPSEDPSGKRSEKNHTSLLARLHLFLRITSCLRKGLERLREPARAVLRRTGGVDT